MRKHFAKITTLALMAMLALSACAGQQGDTGPAGPDGANGANGTNGINGKDGKDGVSCTVTSNTAEATKTITCTDGTSATISNGKDGKDGLNGKDGQNGTNGKDGTNGLDGKDGANGKDGASGTNGLDGKDGTNGTDGKDGANGKDGKDGTSCTVVNNGNGTRTITCGDGSSIMVFDAVLDYNAMTADERAESALNLVVTDVTIPADGRPEVTFKVSERHGYGVTGLTKIPQGSTAMVTGFRFAFLKLADNVNGSANTTWVSYMANNDHSSAGSETATAAGFTDKGDGMYSYKLTRNITAGKDAAGTTYEADKIHRMVVIFYASGNPFPPVNVVKDFVPSTGADMTNSQEKVDAAACLECHTTFRTVTGGAGALGAGEFHGGVRYDVRTCVACHNDQRRFSSSGAKVAEPAFAADGTWTGNAAVINGEAVINFPVMIHKIHMGKELALHGGTYAGLPQPYEVTYPQDIRNCSKCHRAPAAKAGTYAEAANVSIRACGACHDGKSFVTPVPNGRTAHSGGAQADDKFCGVCHSTGGLAGSVLDSHKPIAPPDPNNTWSGGTNSNTNSAYIAGVGYVPKGAKVITYDLKSVSTWLDESVIPSVKRPQMVFKFKMADPTATPPVGATDVVFQTYAAGVTTELMAGFTGSPSAYFVYAVPQDGRTTPADYNVSASAYIKSVWNGTATSTSAGTLTGPDATGYYTLQLKGVAIPDNATMLTGGLGYTYSLGSAPSYAGSPPLVQTDLPDYPLTLNATSNKYVGGLIVPPPDVAKVAEGHTGRRQIVDNAKCGSCHVTLGVSPTFHAGQRNDAPTCSFCHNPNRTSTGWSANVKDFVHSIHGSEKRSTPFTWQQQTPEEGFWAATYPAVLNKCETCHLPGTYDFSGTAAAAAVPNLLPSTVAQGRYNGSAATNTTFYRLSPYITKDNTTDYGYGFSTSDIKVTLPNGVAGTQGTTNCAPATPCVCSAANPCTVTISGPYTWNNVPVTMKQGATTCSEATPCACTTAVPCTGTLATCSPAAPCQPQATTLVVSPIAAACSSCHDSASAVDHMQGMGASFYEPRSSALAKPEQCLLCHGPGKLAAVGERHAIKP